MERLTKRVVGCFEYALKDHKAVPGEFGTYDAFFDYSMAVKRLGHYEDTGLDPEDMAHWMDLFRAECEGRLVVLDEHRKPLVWGNDDQDSILCPSCKHDLMGGFPESDSCETPMYQCPYCGQPIDGTRALTREEAEAAMAWKGGDG